MTTATLARIRRCNRETEAAVAQNPGLLAARPDAKPVGEDEFTTESFFDLTAHAQAMNNERFAVLSSLRANEAAEASEPLRIGTDIPVSPVLPYVRMRDTSRAVDAAMLVKGLAIDFAVEKNSIEAVG